MSWRFGCGFGVVLLFGFAAVFVFVFGFEFGVRVLAVCARLRFQRCARVDTIPIRVRRRIHFILVLFFMSNVHTRTVCVVVWDGGLAQCVVCITNIKPYSNYHADKSTNSLLSHPDRTVDRPARYARLDRPSDRPIYTFHVRSPVGSLPHVLITQTVVIHDYHSIA